MINNGRGVLQYAPTESPFRSPSQTIGAIIRGFKSATTKQINKYTNTPGKPVWQRNYYDRIIRDEDELNRIRQYIIFNPAKWTEDSPREMFLDLFKKNMTLTPISRGKENPQRLMAVK